MRPSIVLTAEQMRAAEQTAFDAGLASEALMETAGTSVADAIRQIWSKRAVHILCGPGNNGGDGFVVARRLKDAGWPVEVSLVGARDPSTADAAHMAKQFSGEVAGFDATRLADAELIVDALFGIGLTRPVTGQAAAAIEAINAHPAPKLAIDLPSGVETNSGQIAGIATKADRTITFHTLKPAHLLYPGRAYCGQVDIGDIGLQAGPDRLTYENTPALWADLFPRPNPLAHKYDRGHVMVLSGGALTTGAARLSATGALRIGAGLVTMLSPAEACPVHAAHLTAIMLREVNTPDEIGLQLASGGRRVIGVIGPAAGLGKETITNSQAMLEGTEATVLDADALTSFKDTPGALFSTLRPGDVLTPHTGEFARLFPDLDVQKDKLTATRTAAERAGAVIVLKGADTVIAAPDGRAAINTNAPPNLATAGSGDVLAGFIAGLIAQGLPGFEAAAAGVWIHGRCGQHLGPGLIAEDLPQAVGAVLKRGFETDQHL